MPVNVNHNDNLKRMRLIIGLLVLVGVGGPLFLFIHSRASNPSIKTQDLLHSLPASQRLEIRGFRYNGNFGEEKVLTIEADRFHVEKKKLGFLRFGLMNEARFENTLIRAYGAQRLAGANAPSAPDNGKPELAFDKAFSKEALSSFPIKRISAIIMEPVQVELCDAQSVVTRISADSAVLRSAKQYILFKGNVRVKSSGRLLTTERLVLLPERASLKTGSEFLLDTPVKKIQGRRLAADLFLNPIEVQTDLNLSALPK